MKGFCYTEGNLKDMIRKGRAWICKTCKTEHRIYPERIEILVKEPNEKKTH